MSDKIPYFCPHCKKILRPFDIKVYNKVGVCLDCQSDLETHIRVTGGQDIEEPLRTKILHAYEEIMKEEAGKDFQMYK